MCGCADVRMYGCVDVWMCGCVDVRKCGCVYVWMCGCADVWMHVARSHCRPTVAHCCPTRRSCEGPGGSAEKLPLDLATPIHESLLNSVRSYLVPGREVAENLGHFQFQCRFEVQLVYIVRRTNFEYVCMYVRSLSVSFSLECQF